MPFMVLDEGGNILSFNKDAGGLLSLKKNNQNIFDIFEDSSSEKFNQYFNNIYEKNKTVSEQVILTLKNGSEIKGLLVLTPYGEENELFIFFTFKEETAKASFNDIADFEINYGDYADFLSDENVIEIIEEVKSLYPFTFIGKEKIRKQVDALEKSFWIKDTTGNYILVNKYFAKSLGLKSSQLEGRSERTFLPQYLQNFFHSVEEYIKESLNCVILKGIPVKGQSIVKNERTVEIPLSDADNKVIAVIGVTENAETEASLDESFFLQMYDLLSQTLTQPFAVFDKEGVYRYGNINFENIFLEKYDKKINKSISDIFPLDISEKVKYFLNALSD